MDAHVLVTSCCSYLCIPECFHLHLLHCNHCIAYVQGGVSVSGGALGLFSLDVCMCQQGGEVVHVVRVALVRGEMHFSGRFCFV